MNRHFLIAILFIGAGFQSLFGQTIKFEFPAHRGNTLYLIANKGIQKDTIFSGDFNEKGDLLFTPPKDKPLSSGVLSFFIKPDIKTDFIYSSKENITLSNEDELFNMKNFKIINSPENDFLMTNYPEMMRLMEKILFCDQGYRYYNETDNFFAALKVEKYNLDVQRASLESILKEQSNNYYSAGLILIHFLMNNYVNRFRYALSLTELELMKDYALSQFDTETLYYSGLWGPYINGLLELYYQESPFFGQFGNDIATLLQGIKSQEIFYALTNDASTICAQFGWNADEISLSKYLIQSDRIINPQGKLKQMLMQYRFEPGMPAPKILISKNQYLDFKKNKTLVVFYESECSMCEKEMELLSDNYRKLKENGIEVVSIAADHIKSVFESSSKKFPWSMKLCDLNGFSGDNFNNYAIMGTPTFYLIDKEGIILGKYAGVKEIMATY